MAKSGLRGAIAAFIRLAHAIISRRASVPKPSAIRAKLALALLLMSLARR
jgi:hypothetical protein